jgi:glucose uptake protein GlcU
MIIDSFSNSLNHWHILHTREIRQPAIMLLMHTVGYNTFVAISRLLRLQATAVRTHAALGVIHSLLKRVVLPAEDVVSMLSISSVVSSRKDERLRAIGGPLSFVVELASVPDDLK